MDNDQNLEQSLRDLAETLAPMESPEAIRDIVERTRALQLDIRARKSIYVNNIYPLACLAHDISKLPSTDIWQQVEKTNDLEIFFYQSQWIYKRIGQAFFNTALILSSKNQLQSSAGRSPEEKEIFQRFTDQEEKFGEGAYIRAERQFSKTANRSDLKLIHRVAEKLYREWDIINYIYPKLIEIEGVSCDFFESPESIFLQILRREAEHPILQRSRPYFEYKPSEEKQSWQRLQRAYKKNIPENQLQRLFRELNRTKDGARDTILLAAIELSKNDEQLSKKLARLDRAIEDLADDVAKDLARRGSQGHKYSQEVWKNGHRFRFDNNQLIKAPYSQEPDEIIITNLQDRTIINL